MEEVVVARMQAVEFARAILEARDAELAFTLQVQETLRNYAGSNDDVDDNVWGFGLDHDPPLVVAMQEDDRDAALRFSVQELGSLAEATDEFQSSLAEAARLAQLDSIQEHDAVFARSLANMPRQAWDSKGGLSSDPFNPNVKSVEKEVLKVEDFDLVLQLVQESTVPTPERMFNRKTSRIPLAHTGEQHAKGLLENSLLEAKNNGKGKLVDAESGNPFSLHLANRSSLPSTSKTMGEADEDEDEDDAIGREVCQICFEATSATSPFFRVEGCGHRYCKPCNAKHAEARVQDGQVEISCLHAGCPTTLSLAHLSELLSIKTLEILTVRQIEAAIPQSERVYCPFQDCSTLLVKPNLFKDKPTSSQHPHPPATGCVECESCHRAFCMECTVPWHGDQSCAEYQAHLQNERLSGDQKLHQLATKEKWQSCKKCGRVVELAWGCNHMTCICGHGFCYICGSPWLSRTQRTCSCNLWDERNLIKRQ